MSREKQIEEIANILWNIPNNYSLNSYNDCERIAECIYDDGSYRKQNEVVMEIFDDILKIKGLELHDWEAIFELKKKYTDGR